MSQILLTVHCQHLLVKKNTSQTGTHLYNTCTIIMEPGGGRANARNNYYCCLHISTTCLRSKVIDLRMRFLLPVPRVSWCHFRTIISTRARHESFKTSSKSHLLCVVGGSLCIKLIAQTPTKIYHCQLVKVVPLTLLSVLAFICTKSNGLTDGLSKHLSGVMTEYDSLLERANSSPPQNEDEHRKLYRSIIKLKPIVELVKRFKSKTSVINTSEYHIKAPCVYLIAQNDQKEVFHGFRG